MHVLHVVSSLEIEAGSVAISLCDLFGYLRAADVASTIVTLDSDPPACEGSAAERFDPPKVGGLVAGSQVVHFHGFDSALARRIGTTVRRWAKPYVISPLGALSRRVYEKVPWTERFRRWRYDRRIYRDAAVITALNEREARELRRTKTGWKVQVLPYGIDLEKHSTPVDPIADRNGMAGKRCLLILGPIHPVEGIVPLLRAIAELGPDFQGWHVILAGPEREGWRAQLQAAIERKGFSDRITFVVNPDLTTQRSCLARASLLLAPNLCPRCPCGVQQAIAAGVPVLTSDHGLPSGMQEAIRVCRPDRHILREVVRSLIRLSDAERAAMAAKARRLAEQKMSWKVLAPQYAQLYKRLGQQKR